MDAFTAFLVAFLTTVALLFVAFGTGLRGLRAAAGTTIRLLGQDAPATWRQQEDGVVVELPAPLSPAPAHALVLTPIPHAC